MNKRKIAASIVVGLIGAITGGFCSLVCGGIWAANQTDYLVAITLIPGAVSGFISCFAYSLLYLVKAKGRDLSRNKSGYPGWWSVRGGGTYGTLAGATAGLVTGIIMVVAASLIEASYLGMGTLLTFAIIGAIIGALVGKSIGTAITHVFEAMGWFQLW
jgi:hypothetical protein